MLENYSAVYRDKFGKEETAIQNDGKSLRMVIRGIEFKGSMLDDWEPATTIAPEQLASFPLRQNSLNQYTLEFEVPIPVVEHDRPMQGYLRIRLDLDALQTNRAGGREELQLELFVENKSFKSCGKHGWFEDELQEIQNALPAGVSIKSCFTCAFSDYNPAGFGLFGCMACFRNSKQEYLSLRGKAAYFQLQSKITERVQETYLCPEYEKRVSGTGYRG